MSDPVVLLSTGDVVGPAGGVTDSSMVLFSGTSGKLIKGNNAVVTAAGLALLDDVNAAAQRVTLGLGTAATATLTTSSTDPTAGSVLKVGDFGVGGMLDLRGKIFVTGKPQDLYAKGFVKGFADGGPAGLAIPGIVNISYGVLEVNAHWAEASGAGGIVRSFTQGHSGVVYTQTMENATTWGSWREIALINSPTFTGVPSAPTAYPGTNTTQLANTAFVKAAVDDAPRVGVGQTWQDVTGSRGVSTNYTNTTGKPIEVSVSFSYAGQGSSYIVVDGVVVNSFTYSLGGTGATMSAIVPNGSVYSAVGVKVRWTELR